MNFHFFSKFPHGMSGHDDLEGLTKLTLERVIPTDVTVVLAVLTIIIEVEGGASSVGIGGHNFAFPHLIINNTIVFKKCQQKRFVRISMA